jgi:small-conductance mechanosensitive channel
MDAASHPLSGLLPWAAGLVVGFPLALILFSELALRAGRAGWPVASTFRSVRNLVLPALALVLFLQFVLQRPADDPLVRFAYTAFWVAVLFAGLSFVNDVIFRSAPPGSWQSKVPTLVRDLARVVLVAVGAAVVYSQVWGKDIGGTLTVLGVTSIVFGLALQDPLGNIFSGLTLLFERPFHLGDWVTVDGATGKVIEINWRSVHIETAGHEVKIVPNSALNKGSFSNLSRPTPARTVSIDLSFPAACPPNRVKQALLELLRTTPGVLAAPAPEVQTVSALGDSASYRASFTVTREEDVGAARDAFMTRLWYAARREGLADGDGRVPEVGRAALQRGFPQFRLADGAEQEGGFPVLSFAAGERLIEEGQRLEGLHLVVKGSAALSIRDAEGEEREIARVGRGEFFGENSLSSGQVSELAVTALEDLDVVVLAPDAVLHLLTETPRAAREIGKVLDLRRQAVKSARRVRAAAR